MSVTNHYLSERLVFFPPLVKVFPYCLAGPQRALDFLFPPAFSREVFAWRWMARVVLFSQCFSPFESVDDEMCLITRCFLCPTFLVGSSGD